MTYRFLSSKSRNAGVKLLASSLINFLQTEQNKSRVVNVLMSGGNTPLNLYEELLCSYPNFSWKNCRIIMLDERYVPFDSIRSNSGQCYRHFIRHIDALAFIYPDTARSIDDCVKSYVNSIEANGVKTIDIAIVGTADDGHLASIFPDSTILFESNNFFACKPCFDGTEEARVSFTLDFINKSENIWMMAFGADKQRITNKAKNGENSCLPALNLNQSKSTLWFYTDSDE